MFTWPSKSLSSWNLKQPWFRHHQVQSSTLGVCKKNDALPSETTWFHRPLEREEIPKLEKPHRFQVFLLFVSGRVTLVDSTDIYVDFHQPLAITLPPFPLFGLWDPCLPQRKVDSYLEKQASTSKFHRRFWPFWCRMKTWDRRKDFLGWMSIVHFPETFANMLGCWPWQIPLPSMAAKMRPHREAFECRGCFFFFFRPNRTNLFGIVWGTISTEIFCWIVKTKCKKMMKDSKTTTKRHGSQQKISNQFFLPFWRIGHFRRVLFFFMKSLWPLGFRCQVLGTGFGAQQSFDAKFSE